MIKIYIRRNKIHSDKSEFNLKTYKGASLFFVIMALVAVIINFFLKNNIKSIISYLVGLIIGYILVCIYIYYKNK